ncbi:MAG: nitroreductase family protein [Phenylobacterium sp.]|nr:MAG: nitroreductase family protein [Phenylobacterium sp.]
MTFIGELVEIPRGRAPQGVLGLERLLRPSAEGRGFSGRAVSLETLEELHALMAVGPGMTGASPTRVLFVTSPSAKARLARRLAPRTRDAAVLAPACAVVGYDRQFAEQLIAFVGDGVGGESCFDRPGTLKATAMRNSVLQGAYLALSARALGLDAAFLHGFDGVAVAAEFFRDPGVSAIFVAALGYPLEPAG